MFVSLDKVSVLFPIISFKKCFTRTPRCSRERWLCQYGFLESGCFSDCLSLNSGSATLPAEWSWRNDSASLIPRSALVKGACRRPCATWRATGGKKCACQARAEPGLAPAGDSVNPQPLHRRPQCLYFVPPCALPLPPWMVVPETGEQAPPHIPAPP